MSFERAITWMEATRSRFPHREALRRLVNRFDSELLYTLLQASPFEEELLRHLPQRTSDDLVPKGLRIVADGADRLRRETARRLGRERDLALFWETEGVIRALRYHGAKGVERERRYRFVPLLGPVRSADRWNRSLDTEAFVEFLRQGKHPLAAAIDPASFKENREEGERAILGYLYATLVPRQTCRYPTTAPYYRDRADLTNGRTALLVAGVEKGNIDPDRWFVDGGGRIARPLFRSLCRGERKEGIERLSILFGVETDDAPIAFARRIEHWVEGRQFRRGVENPLGPNRVLWLMTELDHRVADLRSALIFGGAGAPADETASLFMGRAA